MNNCLYTWARDNDHKYTTDCNDSTSEHALSLVLIFIAIIRMTLHVKYC